MRHKPVQVLRRIPDLFTPLRQIGFFYLTLTATDLPANVAATQKFWAVDDFT